MIEVSTKVELSYGENQVTPCGKVACSSSMRSLTAPATPSALAPGASCTAKPDAGVPLHCRTKPYADAPFSTRATSFRRTVVPSLSARRMMLPKCSAALYRPSADTVAVDASSPVEGPAPHHPAQH